MQIDEFCLRAIEISEARLAALEIAKLALRQYASGVYTRNEAATLALHRIDQLEKGIE